MSMFALPEPTPEEREAQAAKAAERAATAERIVRERLIAFGAPEDAVDAVMPSLVAAFQPRLDRSAGVLVGGLLSPGYAFSNPYKHDPDMPRWAEFDERERLAQERARLYHMVRMDTGWIER